jgi:hypothetical protein
MRSAAQCIYRLDVVDESHLRKDSARRPNFFAAARYERRIEWSHDCNEF